MTRVLSFKMGGIKKVVEIRLNKKKKHNKYFMLGKSKINNIENLISQASKEDIRMMKSSDELGENNKSIRESRENT